MRTRHKVQCPGRGAGFQSATRHPLRSTRSGRARSPATSLLRGTPTPIRPFRRASLPSLGDTTLASFSLPAIRLRVMGQGVGIPVPEPDMLAEMVGALSFRYNPRVPAACSWTPVGPATPGHYGVPTWPPLVSTTEATVMKISGLDNTELGLAVYASPCRLPTPRARLASSRWSLLDGLSTRRVPLNGFKAVSYISSPLAQASCRNRIDRSFERSPCARRSDDKRSAAPNLACESPQSAKSSDTIPPEADSVSARATIRSIHYF
jgi:hypothetical protein